MSEHTTPAVPARTTITCDKCHKDIKPGGVDVQIERMDRDFGGGIVYSHKLHLCVWCRRLFDQWLEVEVVGNE